MSYVALRIIKPMLTELFSGFCENDVHVSPKEDEEKDRPKLLSNFARWDINKPQALIRRNWYKQLMLRS